MFENLRRAPVNCLRVFEAAARLGNFARAASELRVTPAAVSQQIKKLEESCGTQLFQRVGRNVRLTWVGEQLLGSVSEGLTMLDNAVGQATRHSDTDQISISTVGAFASRWLVPRLDRWRMAYPEVDIRISTSGHLVDFTRDQIDMAIRIGDGLYPDLHAEQLMPESLVPLCHPKLLDGNPPLKEPLDLNHYTLIHFNPVTGDINTKWQDWLSGQGVDGVETERGLFFNDFVVAINAAITGQGVLLALRSLVTDDLNAGTLVVPFGGHSHQSLGWHLVMPKAQMRRPNVERFRDWLISEAQRSSASDKFR